MLCKHEVTGSIPVSSTNHCMEQALHAAAIAFRYSSSSSRSHSLFPVRRRVKRDGNLETGSPAERIWADRFSEPQGSASSLKEEARMFDNEIDWVTHRNRDLSAERRISGGQVPSALNTRPSTCKESSATPAVLASVQVRRVSLGDMETLRVSVEIQSQRRRIGYLPGGTEAIRLPAWS